MSEALGEARIIIRPDATLFRAQLEEQLALAKKPIVIPVTAAATGAGAAGSAAFASGQKAATVATEELAGAEAVTAKTTAALTREQLASAAASARQASQLERGAASTTLSQFGLRGATLAASGGFIAAAAATTILIKGLRGAVDASENLTVQNKRLSDTVGQLITTNVNRWASGLAVNFGLAKDQAVQFTATLEGLFRNFGISASRATTMSERLVQLAADMAAFKGQGTTTTEALTALQRGLAGNGRALRTFNVFVDQSRVAQEALVETGKKQVSSLTRQELVLARYNLILQDTANQTGAFTRRSDTLAVQSATLGANLRNLGINIGNVIVPQLELAAKDANLLFAAFSKLGNIPGVTGGGGGGGIGGFFKNFAADLLTPKIALQSIHDILVLITGANDQAAASARGASGGFGEEAAAVRGMQGAVVKATVALRGLNQAQVQGQLQAQQTAVAQAQAFGGTGLSQLERELARIDRILNSRRRPTGKVLEGLLNQRKAILDEIKSINDQAASAAKAAADAVKSAQDKQDQALLALFSTQQTRITDALISAGPKAAIALTIRLRNLFRRQRDEARKQIADLKTRRDTLAADTTEIKTLNKQIRDLQKAQRDAIAQQAQDARDARLTHLEALLSIAETTTRTSDDKVALERIIRFDIQRIDALKKIRHRTRQENAELDALRVDLAQREQALRALTTQQKKNTTAQAEFNFLQTQTGFVQNLLGNLIPGGATGGLVGGGGSPTVPSNVRPGDALSTAQRTSQANLVRGVTSGQAETQTNVLRRILAELHRLNQGRDHPEAHHQRSVGAAIMDLEHDTPGM